MRILWIVLLSLLVLVALAGTAAVLVAYRPFEEEPLPPEVLPDSLLINNTRNLKETEAFLAKYPDVNPFVDRSVRMVVHYIKHHDVMTDGRTMPWVSLEMRMNNQAQPVAVRLVCVTYDIDGYKVTKNIVEYLQKADCFASRPAPAPYAELLAQGFFPFYRAMIAGIMS